MSEPVAVRIPDQTELRNMVKTDPHLPTRLRADRDRTALAASVTARVVVRDTMNRFQQSNANLPPLEGLDRASSAWTAAAVVHAQQLLEEIACLKASIDGVPSLTDSRSMSAKGATELRRATMARVARDEAEKQRERIIARLKAKPVHRQGTVQ